MTQATRVSRSWWLKLGVIALVVIVLGGGTILFLGWSADRRWQAYSAKLRAEGEPLTFVEIDALRTTVPNDKNGARVVEALLDELEAIRSADTPKAVFFLARSSSASRPDFFDGIPGASIQPSREFLEQHRSARDELTRLGDYPDGRFDLTYQPISITMRFPHLAPLRAAAKLLALDAALALIDGEFSRAAEDVQIQLRLAALLNEEPDLITRLVQIAIDALAIKTLENTLRVGELPESILASLGTEFSSHLSSATLRWALWAERANFAETCDQLALGKMSPTGLYPSSDVPTNFGWIPTVLFRRSQLRGTQMLSDLIAARDDPNSMTEAARKLTAETANLSMALYPLVHILLPGLEGAVTHHLRSTAHIDCARAAVAAERFRLNTDRLPSSPDELVPDYLDEWPTDPFDGQPMRLMVTDDGIVIYSVDDDAIDDGGSVAPVEGEKRARDVGFRLFKLDRRGLLIIDETSPAEAGSMERSEE
ncbi:MAG: hypothetical protein IID37_05500 [Planctomycetes bacterium]|nr:hypothetical protein [Planctomycetota bacterium]